MNLHRHAPPLVAVIFLAASGCATTRAVTIPPATVPAGNWSAAAQVVSSGARDDLSQWWRQLGDAPLTGLIERTLQNSLDIRSAQARLRQVRAERGVAKADLLPSVSTSATASDRKQGARTLSASFDASWEPDVFGGARKALDAASAEVRAAAEDLHGTQVSLAAEVARNYVELRTLQARLQIARDNEKSQAETLELTGFRAQAGLVGSIDVERARANLEETRAQIPALESSVEQAIHRLSTLAGLQPATLTGELSAAAKLPVVPSQVGAGIPAETLRQRPDVRAAEQRVIAETARLAQAGTRRYPRFTLSGSIGTEIVSGALTGGTSLLASAAASALQTVFDGGRIRQQIAIQDAVQEQAVASYEATVLTALEDVENALVSLEKTRQRLDSLRGAETAAENAALLARTQYRAGLTDFQTVLDTERTVLSVQDSLATTEGDRLTALIQLYKALGGGWPARPTLAGDETTTS